MILKLARRYTDKDLIIGRDSCNKPYFKNHKALHFNISHTSTVWTIAFSKSQVGIDIEKMKIRNFQKITERIGTDVEISNYLKCKDKTKDFYILWTLKEAISKCIGQGFKYGFNKIHTEKWNGKTYSSKKFILSVASKNKNETFRILASPTSSVFRRIS